MSKIASLVPFAALLLAACVIGGDGDDDGNGDTSGNSTTASTTNSTTASTTNATTASTTDVSTGESSASSESSVGTSAESTAADTAAESSTGNAGACGWGMTGEKTTPFGYICGGEGEDPDQMIDIDCPAAVELVDQGDCGGNMGITGAGCCDAEGNLWFCADDAAERRLFTQDC